MFWESGLAQVDMVGGGGGPGQAMIDEFDKDQDGEINEDEFVYIMKQSTSY